MLLSHVYFVWKVVETPTIILNKPVFTFSAEGLCYFYIIWCWIRLE